MPVRHNDATFLQTRGRQHRILRTLRWAYELVAGGFMYDRGEPRPGNNFFGKFIPGALAAIRGVHDPAGFLTTELDHGMCQIDRICGGTALVAYHFQLRASRGQLQNGVGETLPAGTEEPRSPDNAALGNEFGNLNFRLGF